MAEEEYDDELPSISVQPPVREPEQFSMPPADVLASQRAREEECAAELRQLRAQFAPGESSGSESEGSLAAAVDALDVAAPPDARPPAPALLARLADRLRHYNTDFLALYLELLQTNNDHLIQTATNEISSTMESAVVDAVQSGLARSEGEVVVMLSWLLSSLVWAGPRVPNARAVLHALLVHDMATDEAVAAAGRAAGAALGSAGALVRAADAARGPGRARLLADTLLRAALDHLAPDTPHESSETRACEGEGEGVGVAYACARLGGARGATQHAALQVLGRARWPAQEGAEGAEGGEGAARAALRAVLARAAQPPPAHRRHSPDCLKILVGASKLQILFKVNP